MPLYSYRWTDERGGTFDEFQHMKDESLTEYQGRPCERTVQSAKVQTAYGAGNRCDPVRMESIGLSHPDDIAEFRQRNPGVQISSDLNDPDYGVPIVYSRSEKKRVLEREGFVDTKSYS